DTVFATFYPINPHKKFGNADGGIPVIVGASSFHPGGANFAFLDGSVRFLKETIETWPADPATGRPLGGTWDFLSIKLAPGVRFGVYQALSTRAGGEVLSADAY